MRLGVTQAAELLGMPRRRAFRWAALLPTFAQRLKFLPFGPLTAKDVTLLALMAEVRRMGKPLRTAILAVEKVAAEWDGQAAPAGNLLIANGQVAFGPFTLIADGVSQPLSSWPGLVNLVELTQRVAGLLEDWQEVQEVDDATQGEASA